MKMKIFLANSVRLDKVPAAHRGNNGNCQYSVLVRAESRKAVAAMLGVSEHLLRSFHGIQERGKDRNDTLGFGKDKVVILDIVQKDNTIYYKPEHTRSGYIDRWFEYMPEPDFRLPDYYFKVGGECILCEKPICMNNFARASHLAKHINEGRLLYQNGGPRRSARYALTQKN